MYWENIFSVKNTSKGFTLMEMLVVILVIAVLAAVAVPQYQRAVSKSRYNALMPLAKSVNANNEVYFLTHGKYAQTLADLDLASQEQYPEGTSLELHQSGKYSYVLAKRTGLNNNLVIYQNHSTTYPANVHCEAKKEDAEAAWLCEEALQGTKIQADNNTRADYDVYVLQGDPNAGRTTTAYVNQSGVTLGAGDTCTTTQANGCQHLTTSGATCTGDGKTACAYSEYTNNSTCEGNTTDACIGSSFTGSTCDAGAGGTCRGSTFVSSTCNGNVGGNNASNTSCGSDSTYIDSKCYNKSNTGYACGRSTYQDNSECYSNKYGGCGHSTFSNGSVCYGESNTGCDHSHFKEGSVCYANVAGACKLGTGSYDETSYCAGDYCPEGTPKEDGTQWRACDSAHGDPQDKIKAKKSC